MKKTTLFLCLTFLISGGLQAQSYTTGMMALSSNNNTNLNFSAQIEVSSTLVTLTMVGPSASWLGIGFNNTTMPDSGDVVIFDGTNITDRHFIGFATEPDLDANQDWTVTSNTVSAGVRTVVGTRARDTGDANDYVFSAAAQSLNVVYARKLSDNVIEYHGPSSCGHRLANFTLGTEDFKIDSFKISPNPAKGFTAIELPANVNGGTVKIYDALGRVVKKAEISTSKNNIDTSGLTSGSYMVVLRTEYGNATKTLLVQ